MVSWFTNELADILKFNVGIYAFVYANGSCGMLQQKQVRENIMCMMRNGLLVKQFKSEGLVLIVTQDK